MKKVVILEYNAGNVMSVKYAMDRLGVNSVISSAREDIETATHIIFPGVGEASTAMKSLQKTGLDQLIPSIKKPFMGTCLGMQLLCSYSQEGDVDCLGIFDTPVLKFNKKENFKIPQTGWNSIHNYKSSLLASLKEEAYVYFNHSYYVPINKHTVAETNYILPYSSMMQKGNFYACQFHSEISGNIGESIFKNFLNL